jgi:hypothetical protein
MKKLTDDGRQVMAIPHMTLWIRWAKKEDKFFNWENNPEIFPLLSLTLYNWNIVESGIKHHKPNLHETGTILPIVREITHMKIVLKTLILESNQEMCEWSIKEFSNTEFEFTTLVVIGTDCTGSCKSNYHDSLPVPCKNSDLWQVFSEYHQ